MNNRSYTPLLANTQAAIDGTEDDLRRVTAELDRLKIKHADNKALFNKMKIEADAFLETAKRFTEMPRARTKFFVANDTQGDAVTTTGEIINPSYGYAIRFRPKDAGPKMFINGTESGMMLYQKDELLEFLCVNQWIIKTQINAEISISNETFMAGHIAIAQAGFETRDKMMLFSHTTDDTIVRWDGRLDFQFPSAKNSKIEWEPITGTVVSMSPCAVAIINQEVRIVALDEMWVHDA